MKLHYRKLKHDALVEALRANSHYAPRSMREKIACLERIPGNRMLNMFCLYCIMTYQRYDINKIRWASDPKLNNQRMDQLVTKYSRRIEGRNYAMMRYLPLLEEL